MSRHLDELRQERRVSEEEVMRARIAVLENPLP